MKYVIGIYHTLYLQYIGLFGGKESNKTFYVWCTVYLNKNKEITLDECHFILLRKFKYLFIIFPRKINGDAEGYFE